MVVILWLIYQQGKDYEDLKIDMLETNFFKNWMKKIKNRKNQENFFSTISPDKKAMIKDQEAFINIFFDTYRIPREILMEMDV